VRTLIVLPTLEEAVNVANVLRRVRAVVPAADVLVVDDASRDGTADVAEAVGRELGGIEVLRRTGGRGLGRAYREGLGLGLARGYEALVEMDADLSHDPAVLPRLLAPLARGADLVVGSRYVPGGSIPDWSRRRRALSRAGNRYAAAALRLDLTDLTSGFRAYRAETLRSVDLATIRSEGYAFQVEMAYRVIATGGRVVEVPIEFTDRTRGRSKMSTRVVVEALARVTWWGARDRLLRRRAPLACR
jgi:dolichol-phosphate mannosyltransferase